MKQLLSTVWIFLWSKIKGENIYIKAGLVFFIIAFIGHIYFNGMNDKIKAIELKYQMATDKMVTYRNADSTHVSRISVLQDENARVLLKTKSKDSSILFLQAEVKKYKGKIKEPGSSVTTITNNTSAHGTSPTTIPNPVSPSPTVYPVYNSIFNSEWISLAINARHDSTNWKLRIINKYSVVIGFEKGKPFAEVTNKNPYTETTSLRSYEVTVPKPKRVGIGFQAGYGVTKNGIGPFVGIGLSYNLIQIK
jgi:hypothetical protein